MNLAITKLNPAQASASAQTPAPAAASPSVAPGGLAPSVPVQDAAPAFAQWLDQLSAPADLMAGQDEAAGAKEAAPAAASTGPDAQEAQAAAQAQDPALLAAMALPLMMPAPVGAASLPLAPAGGGVQLAVRGTATRPAIDPLTLGATAVAPTAASTLAQGGLPGAGLPAALPSAAPAALPAPLPSAADLRDAQDPGSADGATTPASQAAPRLAAATSGTGDRAGADQAAPVATPGTSVAPGGWGVATPSVGQPAAPATVALAGPPVAWRQSLQEALGDRLHMQVGNNIEQAVIRLEPPDLGRIDIAIRHIAGTLEVALSATHSEVVRQLHSVSDNLRNDLAGRQYADVTVSVSQAPRAQQAGQSAFADQQGRQRQGGREQDDAAPGLALADAGGPSSTFSLNGRE